MNLKRFLAMVWCVMCLSGPALAQLQPPDVTVWIQARDGTNNVTLCVSETAVIQLWMSLSGGSAERPIVNITAALRGYNAAFGKDLSFEVAGFNDIIIPNSQMQRGGRGPNIEALLPNAHIDEYSFFAVDDTANNGTDGVQGTDRSFLMDEIIIHGVAENVDADGTKNSDLVIFAFASNQPWGFYMDFDGLTQEWSIAQLPSVAMGTGDGVAGNFFLVNVTGGECSDDADCDDGDSCTIDACVDCVCVHTADPDDPCCVDPCFCDPCSCCGCDEVCENDGCVPLPGQQCCFPDGSCSDVAAPCCTELGGSPLAGMCFPAGGSPPEACCLEDGTCIDTDPTCCTLANGTPLGPGTVCQPTEACCLEDGACIDTDPTCCILANGTPQGPGTDCQPTEACCLEDGTCIDTDPMCCTLANGTPQGPGTDCQPTGACCLDELTCIITSEECCAGLEGIFLGANTTCPTQTILVPIHTGPESQWTHVIETVVDCPNPGRSAAGCTDEAFEIDPWTTELSSPSCEDFGNPDACPIPADFFGPGSDPFTGSVCLEGVPLGPTPFGEFGDADTLVRRTQSPFDRCDVAGSFPSAPVTVDIEVVALSLMSINPITVTFNGGQNPEQWDVEVTLSDVASPPSFGTLTATKTHCNGGTYDSDLNVTPKFIFTRQSDMMQVELDVGAVPGCNTVNMMTTDDTWVHDTHPNLGVMNPVCTDFFPGIDENNPLANPSDCDCNVNMIRDECELTGNDCNLNGIPDECDIAADTSTDDNGNGIPDECEMPILDMDIKPGSCPNSYNRNSHGVLPVGLLGTDGFDVTQVDLSTVQISRADGVGGSVGPNEGPPGPHSVFADVGTPFDGELCNCHEATTDGMTDLSMKFKTDDLVAALELNVLAAGALVELTVSGQLLDGTPFEASDCVRLVPPGTPPGQLRISAGASHRWIDVQPLDLTLDGGGFGAFNRVYPMGSVVTLEAPANTSTGKVFDAWVIDGIRQPTGLRTIQITVASENHDITSFYKRLQELSGPSRQQKTGVNDGF